MNNLCCRDGNDNSDVVIPGFEIILDHAEKELAHFIATNEVFAVLTPGKEGYGDLLPHNDLSILHSFNQ